MGAPDDELLVTTEGVDEGSAAATGEDQATGGQPRAGQHEPVRGADRPAAPPVDMESDDSRAARADHGTGQQLAEGEG